MDELFVRALLSLLLPLLGLLLGLFASELELPELELPELALPGLVALPSLDDLPGELLIELLELELLPLLDPVVSLAPPSFLLHPTKASAAPIIRNIFFI